VLLGEVRFDGGNKELEVLDQVLKVGQVDLPGPPGLRPFLVLGKGVN
jgi:hypothetical protein